jgi:hypothetical protein
MTRKAKPTHREHLPRAGRRAYVCDGRRDDPCGERRFMRPNEDVPECKRHGKMRREPNRPYRGQAIPE